MKKISYFIIGMIVGALTFGGSIAYAAGIMAERSHHRIFVDDQEVQLTAYNVESNNYVKLRDIGKAVGFNVYWSTEKNGVQIETDKPYTGVAPDNVSSNAESALVDSTGKNENAAVYTISTDYWSREDFSQQANPAVFSGTLNRNLYNAIRQTLVDTGKQDNASYRYAYTMVGDEDYSTAKNVLGRMDGVVRYEHHVPANLGNYYAYLDYFAVSVEEPENYADAINFIQPVMEKASQLGTDREKVIYLNDYLCTLLSYDRNAAASIEKVFSDHLNEVQGACGTYARAFSFLCDSAGICCMTIRSENHVWNLVYIDNEWLHVDVTNNDASANKHNLLLSKTSLGYTDKEPQMTAFLKEVLVPGSTK